MSEGAKGKRNVKAAIAALLEVCEYTIGAAISVSLDGQINNCPEKVTASMVDSMDTIGAQVYAALQNLGDSTSIATLHLRALAKVERLVAKNPLAFVMCQQFFQEYRAKINEIENETAKSAVG